MASRAATRRRKKARTQGQDMPQAATTHETPTTAPTARKLGAARPTRERMMQGKWAKPQGADKRSQPMVDLASDMIGALYESRQINAAQEQAARTFDELWAAYRSELEVQGFKSCLAGGMGSHDEGEGNPAICAAWRALETRIGRISMAVIKLNIERGPTEKPIQLEALKSALNRVAGG